MMTTARCKTLKSRRLKKLKRECRFSDKKNIWFMLEVEKNEQFIKSEHKVPS